LDVCYTTQMIDPDEIVAIHLDIMQIGIIKYRSTTAERN